MACLRGRPSPSAQTKLSRWCVMLRAWMRFASTREAASLRAVVIDLHHSSASCSYQPGRGASSGKVALPSATEWPLSSHTTALVAVVEQSIPMTYLPAAMLDGSPRHPHANPFHAPRSFPDAL